MTLLLSADNHNFAFYSKMMEGWRSGQLDSPLDKLLSQALLSMIKEKLGSSTCQKIESRLQERHRMSLAESIKEFNVLDATLREFFGDGADGIEADFLDRIMSLTKPQGSVCNKSSSWIEIKHSGLVDIILGSYGDKDKRQILDAVAGQPRTISMILSACTIPKSSGYRIINEILQNGLLFEEGISRTSDGKKVSSYGALFQRVKIDIKSKDSTNLQGLVKETVLLRSNILRIACGGTYLS
jgi:hypothetical protein